MLPLASCSLRRNCCRTSFSFAAIRLPMVLPYTMNEVPRLAILPTDVSEARKVKCFRLPFPTLCPPFGGRAPELDQARLLRMRFQSELPQPLLQFRHKPVCILPMLKPQHG